MAILCCISSSKAFVEETRSTLRFAMRAKLVQMTPKVNEVSDDSALIKKLREELAEARRALEEMKRLYEESRQGRQEQGLQPSRSTSLSRESSSESLGYEEVTGGSRNYVMPKDQPDPRGPGPQNRAYVMPKVQSPMPNSRKYIMPKGQQLPLELKNNLNQMMKDRFEELEKSKADFQLDAVSPEMAQKTVFRYMHGDTDEDSDGPVSRSSSNESEPEKSAFTSFDFPIPSGKNLSSPTQGGLGEDRLQPDASHIDRLPFAGKNFLDKNKDLNYSDRRLETTARTAKTEDESYDDDGPEGSYAEISHKFGSVVSRPDTLLGASALEEESKYGTIDSEVDHALDGRANNTLSWDTMDIASLRPGQRGKPLETLKTLQNRERPIPDEITTITVSPIHGAVDICITDRLEDAEARATFFQEKLEKSDDLVEALFRDMERARLCIHDLVFRNVNLSKKIKEKRREDVKEQYQEGEIILEQYWLLKGAMYTGLFFFFTGGYELFMASVILIWLILEANVMA